MAEPNRRTPGRPRDTDAEARIMAAAVEEYAEHGWAGYSLNAVARRAGVSKSTIYLRWPDKDSLLTDSVTARTHDIEDVDTGTLRGDLEALAANLLRHDLDPLGWATLRMAVDAAGAPTPPRRFAEQVTNQHRVAAVSILSRAVERGEATTTLPDSLVTEALYGTITMLALSRPSDRRIMGADEVAAAVVPVVDFVLAAVRDRLVSPAPLVQ
jgi:AcrR family transcriptional regulator